MLRCFCSARRRRLLLRLHPQPSPDGHRGGPGGGNPDAGGGLSLPPTLIQVGAADPLPGPAPRFAAAAGAADVRVTLEIWPHMIHAWPLWNAHLEPGRRALGNAGAFIRECHWDEGRTEA